MPAGHRIRNHSTLLAAGVKRRNGIGPPVLLQPVFSLGNIHSNILSVATPRKGGRHTPCWLACWQYRGLSSFRLTMTQGFHCRGICSKSFIGTHKAFIWYIILINTQPIFFFVIRWQIDKNLKEIVFILFIYQTVHWINLLFLTQCNDF